nr:pseudouridine-metabolizing bifunctional protein [Quercus suber]
MARPWVYQSCRVYRCLGSRWSALSRGNSTKSRFIRIAEEVRVAVQKHRPVVALESTIYTHGLPFPQNLALASSLESLVRLHGGVPATIGVLDGVARVGLSADELTRLVSSANTPNLRKVSRRDLGFVCGLRGTDGKPLSGGTTIAGTMILARIAGIRVFATGGLGGVHRGAERTMDISADLTELGRTPVAVISSGCKAFLDIPKTLEYLETQGVAVATFADGRRGSIDFPAFWTRDSGIPSPVVLRDETDAAQVLQAHFSLGLQSGLHFANPIPLEHQIPLQEMKLAIDQAHVEAHAAGCTGAATTPFILAKIKDLTGSRSVVANTALVESNVVRATKVAVALMHLEERSSQIQGLSSSRNTRSEALKSATSGSLVDTQDAAQQIVSPAITTVPQDPIGEERSLLFVAGSLAVDFSCDFKPVSQLSSPALQQHTSNPARISQSLGGVGHNVARAAHLMGASVRLCSAVGDDLSGQAALQTLSNDRLTGNGIKVLGQGRRTAQYVAFNDSKKDLVMAMADFDILSSMSSLNDSAGEDLITNTLNTFWLPQLQDSRPTHLALDGNWSAIHLAEWIRAGKSIDAYITFEPVSTTKSTTLFSLPARHTLSVFPRMSINLTTPNTYELSAMCTAARSRQFFDRQDWWDVIDALGIPSGGARTRLAMVTSNDLVDQGIPQQCIQLLPFVPCIATKLGAQGVLLTQLLPAGDARLTSAECAPFIISRCNNGTEDDLGVGGVYMRLFPAIENVRDDQVASVNGVGDTFAGTLLAGLVKRGPDARVEELIDISQRAAVLTLKRRESVAPDLGTLRGLL